MAQLISASIDVTKITKSKLYKGEKGTYLNISISINDEVDKYNNQVSITESLTKDENDAKVSKIYLGNGKIVWTGTNTKQNPATPAPAQTPVIDEGDDLPF